MTKKEKTPILQPIDCGVSEWKVLPNGNKVIDKIELHGLADMTYDMYYQFTKGCIKDLQKRLVTKEEWESGSWSKQKEEEIYKEIIVTKR